MSRRWRHKRLDTAPADSREFLIWSGKHHCWHRRGESGGANGYTTDILQAGIFETAKASEYHCTRENRAVHVSKVIKQMREAAAELERKHREAIERFALAEDAAAKAKAPA